jgi:uncharacterized membrane protein YgdD (TMEM256/DUF423 family)
MNKRIIITAAISGILAVISGAFGAHGLKALLSETDMNVWHTAVQYQFYHTLALLFLSTLPQIKQSMVKPAYYCFVSGILLFSGSLYILSTREIHHLNWTSYLGPITPLGGLLLIAGWICLLIAGLKMKHA